MIVESGRWLAASEPTAWLEAVRTAVLEDRRLRMTYRRADAGAAHPTIVDPFGLVAKAGVWYLLAAPSRTAPLGPASTPDEPAEIRLYRVSRIEEATVTDEPSRRPTTLDVAAEWRRLRRRVEERGPGVAVRIAVEPSRSEMLLRMVRSQLVEPPEAPGTTTDRDPMSVPGGRGRVILDLRFVALGAAEGVLLGFGTDVEVLEPVELRASMARAAAAVARLYGVEP